MIVIVRHGNTFESGETPRRIGARTDLALTAKGLAQADALGAYFAERGIQFGRVLMSPLTRTRQTAERILARQTHPPVPTTAEFLREIDYGPDENQTEDQVRARIGSAALDAWEHRAEAPDGWIVAAQDRIAAWRDLFAQEKTPGDHSATLLVTSNGAARYALIADRSLSASAKGLSNLKLPTGGLGIVTLGEHGAMRLVAWGVRP